EGKRVKVAQEEAPLLKRAFRLLEDTESKPHCDRKREGDYDARQKGLRSKQESFKPNRKHHRLPLRGMGTHKDSQVNSSIHDYCYRVIRRRYGLERQKHENLFGQ